MKCMRRIAQDARLETSSPSDTPPPSNLEVGELVTEHIRVVYSSWRLQKGEKVFAWAAAP